MFEREALKEIEREVSGFGRPVLSLYANINPGQGSTQPQAVLARVKNTLRDMDGMPETVAQRVLALFQRHVPESRSLAVFVDAEQMQVIESEVELVQDAGRDHLDVRLGEPYFTPLLAALGRHGQGLALLTRRDDVQVFRVGMNEVEPLFEAQRETVAAEEDESDQSKNRFSEGPANVSPPAASSHATPSNQQNRPKQVADRGDAAIQLAHEQIEASQERFYKRVGQRVEALARELGIQDVLLLGPERDIHLMKSVLPPELARQVRALLPDIPANAPKPSVVLEAVQGALQEAEQQRKVALVDRAAEEGVFGLEPCLRELQQRRLHTLVVGESLQREAFIDKNNQYLALTHKDASAFDEDGDAVKRVDLAHALPEVAALCGAQLEFVHGEVERKLVEEHGGMAGLRRW